MKKIKFDDLDNNEILKFSFDRIQSVSTILSDIRKKGNSAVHEYNEFYDGSDNLPFEVSENEIEKAFERTDENYINALKFAKKNIEEFAIAQREKFTDLHFENEYGRFGHKLIPIQRVCCYVPGGNYPLPSTALMNVIPAKIAGVEEIFVTSPRIPKETIVAAKLAGADRIFRLGGAQAIGAFAYGTTEIPEVDKVVGPGNKYVTAAKKEVYGTVGLDFLAGPSEVLIIADNHAPVKLIAADLLAQAEHDVNARIFFVTKSEKLANQVINEVYTQLEKLKTKFIAEKAVQNGIVIISESNEEMIETTNMIAPEHLEIQVKDPKTFVDKINNYGSLFIGTYSAEVFGDYCSGPNHTLPTGRASRYTGGLSIMDFLKIQTFQELKVDRISDLIDTASKLAYIEGLDGHRKAALSRVD